MGRRLWQHEVAWAVLAATPICENRRVDLEPYTGNIHYLECISFYRGSQLTSFDCASVGSASTLTRLVLNSRLKFRTKKPPHRSET
mmetsp:Transcript_30991/g.45973  ORF Transcript_30991/g.45973 Transcript_30991/m.45973 type:complete len:86 (-) Transcript_30991:847-1104(-)